MVNFYSEASIKKSILFWIIHWNFLMKFEIAIKTGVFSTFSIASYGGEIKKRSKVSVFAVILKWNRFLNV